MADLTIDTDAVARAIDNPAGKPVTVSVSWIADQAPPSESVEPPFRI